MAKLVVNVFDAAKEERLEGLNALEWPTGRNLPAVGERVRFHQPRFDDFQVVRRVFHIGLLPGDLVVDLFVGYVNDA